MLRWTALQSALTGAACPGYTKPLDQVPGLTPYTEPIDVLTYGVRPVSDAVAGALGQCAAGDLGLPFAVRLA